MIARNSASYPVRGAALATGIDYGTALRFVDHVGSPGVTADIRAACIDQHGLEAWVIFTGLIDDAWEAGHLRIRRWAPTTNGWRR